MSPSKITPDPRLQTALSLITARELQRLQARQAVPVETRPESIHSYDETLRLTINTVGTQSVEYRSGVKGWLIGISIFADAIDANDTIRITLQGRDLKQSIRPRATFSIEEDFFEDIDMGDRVVFYYNSTGITVKNIDFTPRVSYSRL